MPVIDISQKCDLWGTGDIFSLGLAILLSFFFIILIHIFFD